MAVPLSLHSLNTNVNPLLANPPDRSSFHPDLYHERFSVQYSAPTDPPASIISNLPNINIASLPNSPLDTPAAVDEPAPTLTPKRTPWQATAARPQNAPKKNQSQAAMIAHAAKAMGGSSAQHKRDCSGSSLTLSNFPVPGHGASTQEVASMNEKFKTLHRKMSFSKDDTHRIDLSLTSAENELKTGLGIHPSRSIADFNLNRAPSNKSLNSVKSHTRSASGNSLGEGVGFTFKNTTNFVHPNRQTPRSYTPLSRSQVPSMTSFECDEEMDDAVVERMNSVTSDGGWKSGWSMNGSQSGSISGPSGEPGDRRPSMARRPSEAPIPEGDYVEDDGTSHEMASRDIIQEEEDLDEHSPDQGPEHLGESLGDQSGAEVSLKSAKSLKSLRSVISSQDIFSIPLPSRPRANTNMSNSSPTSPMRSSFSQALSIINRNTEPEDPIERAANIAAARKAFEEREAAKERKAEKKEAEKGERRRRKSEASVRAHIRRKPSIAVDSAVDGSFDSRISASASGRTSPEQDASPFSPINYSQNETSTYAQNPEGRRESAYGAPHQIRKTESALFPAYKEVSFAPTEDIVEPQETALWPPPNRGQVYKIGGKLFDEFGMSVDHLVSEHEDDDGAAARNPSNAKKAKGKLVKFSAWGKTRLLRA